LNLPLSWMVWSAPIALPMILGLPLVSMSRLAP
jgi:hypothetical protein